MLHGGAGAGARPRLLPRAAGGVISARELAVDSAYSASGGASVPDGPNERRTSFYISDRQRRQRRDDSPFSAPCKALPTVWRAPQQPETCGARLGYTPSCQPIPGHFVTANRDTSSKPPRFIRRWRRFGDFQDLGFGGVFCILFAAVGKKYAAGGKTAASPARTQKSETALAVSLFCAN